jgi:hypothetical protein
MPANVSIPPPSVMPLIGAFMVSRLIYLAAELGIADLIAGGSDTTEALAQKTRTHAPSLFRMMRALCAYGVFEELAPGRFGLGLMGVQLQSEVPGSVRNFARFFGDQRCWKCLAELEHTLRTGETGMKLVFGTTGFEYLASHPAEAEIFNAAMADVTRNMARIAIASYDFSRYRIILDIGGGSGAFLAEVLCQVPSAKGILFDVPTGLTEAHDTLLRADVASRCTVVAGDFFKSVPYGVKPQHDTELGSLWRAPRPNRGSRSSESSNRHKAITIGADGARHVRTNDRIARQSAWRYARYADACCRGGGGAFTLSAISGFEHLQ